MAKRSRKDGDENPQEGAAGAVSRRTFLVFAGSAAIGRFPLPVSDDAQTGPTLRLIGAPMRWGDGETSLLWTEVGSGGEVSTRIWMPETPEEVAEAEAFYAAAAKIDWDKVVLADVPMPGDPGATRRFELVDGNSAKFWEIMPLESGYRVRSGKVGTAGRTQEKSFSNAEAAGNEVAKLIVERTKKGYVEIAADVDIPKKVERERREPVDWTGEDAWEEVFGRLGARHRRGREDARPSVEDLDAFEAAHHFRLPASYRAFIRVFGPGEFSTSLQIYSPGASLSEMGERQDRFARMVGNVDFLTNTQTQAEPIAHMVCLGEDIHIGTRYYGWDYEDVRNPATHEYAIRRYDSEGHSCPIVAASFSEFVNDHILGGDPSSRSFSPAPRLKPRRPEARQGEPKPAAPAKGKRSPAEERDLMLAVVAAPDDPAPWLAYADWLDRYKDKVGPLIRLRLAGPGSADPDREAPLVAGLGPKWNQDIATIDLLPAILVRLGDRCQANVDERGIYRLRLVGELVNARLLDALRRHPALECLVFEDHRLTAAELESLARLDSVRDLDLDSGASDDDLAIVARMTNLELLGISNHRLRGEGLLHLATLPGLSTLAIGDSQDEGAGLAVEALGHLEAYPALRHFRLYGNDFGPEALDYIGRLERLEILAFGHLSIRDEDLRRLAPLVHLKLLDIGRTEITEASLVHLAHMEKLETLHLHEMRLGDVGLAAIGRLKNLERLKVRDDFNNRKLTDAGVAQIAGMTRLEALEFEGTDLSDAALEHLAGLLSLERLKLDGNRRIVGPGLVHLAALPHLKDLYLRVTGLTDTAIPHLLALKYLEDLKIDNCEFSEKGKARLREAFPQAWI
jgi:uncharacterized protein (TIGR02996 family)